MGWTQHFSKAFDDLSQDIHACSGSSSGVQLRYLFHPSIVVCLHYRFARAFDRCGITPLAQFLTFWMRVWTACDIHYRADIGPGVQFPHGNGVVIGEGVTVGAKCSIFQHCSLGSTEHRPGAPFLNEGVNLYPGTVLAGNLEVGEYARIGPNVYLTQSVPSHTRVAPAKPTYHSSS